MKKKAPLKCYAGRKPCGCVVQVVVGGSKTAEEVSRPGMKFEEVPAGEKPKITRCRCEA